MLRLAPLVCFLVAVLVCIIAALTPVPKATTIALGLIAAGLAFEAASPL